MIRLVLPHIKYKNSYIEATKEFQAENNKRASNYLALNVRELTDDFQSYVNKLHNQIKGLNLPEGFIPSTEYWIINEDDIYLGRLHLRHKLNDRLMKIGGHIGYNIRKSQRRKGYASQALAIGLEKAKELNLDRVLITCNDDNIASIKVIEKHGGKLENKIKNGDNLKRRYWININKIDKNGSR